MKILIADDNIKIRSILKMFLNGDVNEYIECSDGNDAVEKYNQTHPDIVLMDIEMGETDGITATKAIITSDPQAKIIIVTQHKSELLTANAFKAGAKGFVLKDNLEELWKVVNEV